MKRTIFALIVLSLLMTATVSASGIRYENFQGGYHQTWYFVNFEDDSGVSGRHPGVSCGVDACAQIQNVGYFDDALAITVNPSTTAGIYTDTDVSEVDLDQADPTNKGTWTATYNHPVTLQARVKWSGNYNQDGSGGVGTSGVVLWNSAVGPTGPGPTYSQIGWALSNPNVLGGLMGGLTASNTENLFPLAITRPGPVNIHNWLFLKLVWSQDVNGVQSVEYFVNNSSIGVLPLPIPLSNLSVEMWNDNQEPTFTGVSYPSPSVPQTIYIGEVRVTQP